MAKDPLSNEIHFWRLDPSEYAAYWNMGVGAEKVGGRWNPRGMATVYAALDASTAILEVAVHKSFDALDCKPHVLTQARVLDRSSIRVVQPNSIANQNWLVPGTPSGNQQQFGAQLLNEHPFVLVPSSVSRHSWNLLMNPKLAIGLYEVVLQEPFALDGRLNPPVR
jgi:RES domain-containing protein